MIPVDPERLRAIVLCVMPRRLYENASYPAQVQDVFGTGFPHLDELWDYE